MWRLLWVSVFGVASAAAETRRSVDYDAQKVFPAAVRFLRITEGATVTERDAEAGFVLFTLKDDGKQFPGALEIIRDDDAGGARTRLQLRIEDRPSYMEAVLLDRFERKLRTDLGSPPPRKRPPPPSDAAPKGDANPPPADNSESTTDDKPDNKGSAKPQK